MENSSTKSNQGSGEGNMRNIKRWRYISGSVAAAVMIRQLCSSAFLETGGILLKYTDCCTRIGELLIAAASSVLSHLIAVLLLIEFSKIISKNQQTEFSRHKAILGFKAELPRNFPFLICAAVMLISIAGMFSNYLFSLIEYRTLPTSDVLSDSSVGFMVLYFFVTVVLPAFTEEIFFRGAIQHIFTEYNRHFAVIGQALKISSKWQRRKI